MKDKEKRDQARKDFEEKLKNKEPINPEQEAEELGLRNFDYVSYLE
jgi:hypothetical protein